jgi:hypothetical protein
VKSKRKVYAKMVSRLRPFDFAQGLRTPEEHRDFATRMKGTHA